MATRGLVQFEQNGPGSHGGQLGAIAHQHQAALGGHGIKQGLHQAQIHHRHLIHHHQIQGQGVAPVAAKAVTPTLQQFVQGAAGEGCASQRCPEPGRSLAGGSRQVDAAGGLACQHGLEHRCHGAGFARARPALQHHQLVLQHCLNGPLLIAIELALAHGRELEGGRSRWCEAALG